jgi:predicted PurR-regulated permease PerM
MNSPTNPQNSPTTLAIEIAIRLTLIFLVMAWCLLILSPFISLVVWGAIIAVAIYSPFLNLVKKLGNRKKLAVTLIAVIGIAVILTPVISLSSSLVDGAATLGTKFQSGQINVPAPSDSVQEWPIIGEKVHRMWTQASVNLGAFLEQYPQQLSAAGKMLLSSAAGVGAGVLQFIVSMLIAIVFLLNADSAVNSMQKLANRLAGPRGISLLSMSASTVRSVAVGVIGIAFIQAMLGGIGMMFAGVPAAGLLAIVILVLAIAQLPPLLVLLPVAIYVFSAESTTVAVIFLVWALLVSFSDMALKPLLLGRGVDVPMLVILLGAIGGMVTSGIVGLFIGAIILAVGYELLRVWVDWKNPENESASES